MFIISTILLFVALTTPIYSEPIIGIEDCGSQGFLAEVRITDCVEVPCKVAGANITFAQLKFELKNPYDLIRTTIKFIDDEGEVLLGVNHRASEWPSGHLHTTVDRMNLMKYSGKSGSLKLEVLGFPTMNVEICALVAVNIA